MATQTLKPSSLDQRIDKLREIYTDASEISKTALERVIRSVKSGKPAKEPVPMASTVGSVPARERFPNSPPSFQSSQPRRSGCAFLELLHADLGNQSVDLVGTVHDMRRVFLDNDTKILFASTYDGDWDPYIDDFGTKIPDILDLQFGEIEGWPGIRSPKIKDFIVKHQIPAFFWYVASPNLTVVETKRLEKIGPVVDEFLDKVA